MGIHVDKKLCGASFFLIATTPNIPQIYFFILKKTPKDPKYTPNIPLIFTISRILNNFLFCAGGRKQKKYIFEPKNLIFTIFSSFKKILKNCKKIRKNGQFLKKYIFVKKVYKKYIYILLVYARVYLCLL